MPVLIMVPRVNSKLVSFWWTIIWKSSKNMFFYQKLYFSEKKSPRQGCTTQKTELGMHQNQSRVGMFTCISNLLQTYFKFISNWPWTCMGPFSENHQKIWMTWDLALHGFRKSYPCKPGGLRGPCKAGPDFLRRYHSYIAKIPANQPRHHRPNVFAYWSCKIQHVGNTNALVQDNSEPG